MKKEIEEAIGSHLREEIETIFSEVKEMYNLQNPTLDDRTKELIERYGLDQALEDPAFEDYFDNYYYGDSNEA
jgi:hypothetical protein